MKKFSILMMFALCSLFVNAQESAAKRAMNECYMLKDGVVHHCIGDATKPISENVTLANGTVISPDGSVTSKEGVTQKVSEGQCVGMNGNIEKCSTIQAGKESRSKRQAPPADQVK